MLRKPKRERRISKRVKKALAFGFLEAVRSVSADEL